MRILQTLILSKSTKLNLNLTILEIFSLYVLGFRAIEFILSSMKLESLREGFRCKIELRELKIHLEAIQDPKRCKSRCF